MKTLFSRRGCLWSLAVLLLLVLVAAGFIYRFASQNVAVRPLLGTGDVTDVAVPDGFHVNVFAEGLNGPRFMALGPDGQIYVADRGNQRVVALPDANRDGVADEVRVFAADLEGVSSLAYHQDAWYVGVPTGVIRLADTDGDGVADVREVILDDYPTGVHNTRTVAFLPDGRMVVSIGSGCNVCVEEDQRRAAISVYDGSDGSGERILARGLRNAVGLTVEPGTGELWVTNNGRDLMGDDLPPETVYRIEDGGDYGWPYCHSGRIVDPDMGTEQSCEGVIAPVVEMQAHSAPLGLTFYTGDLFPAEYRGDLFIAFHGSWNRTVPTGYKVVRLDFVAGRPAEQVTDFAAGWLNETEGTAAGRPVDVLTGPDGALYVSDDKGDLIYRIGYGR